MVSIGDRIKSAWNAFSNDGTNNDQFRVGLGELSNFTGSFSGRPDRNRLKITNERTIISSIYTRMSIDVAAVDIRHTRHDDDDRYLEDISSGLNDCLKVEANLDQAARAFRQDIALTLFDKGVAAIVAVDTTIDPSVSGSYDVKTLRVGEIVKWHPRHVRVSLYNEAKGARQEIVLEKRNVAIVDNPLYLVMNAPNSTLSRLTRKLSLLDSVDEATSSGKLDLIIQLPYVVKSEARKQQAEQRRADLEFQLKGSQYGIGYTDGTEKITQLNRPTENNLLKQIEYLTALLYTQLGLTPAIMDGTADEAAMLNYNNRTIEPIVAAVSEALKRTFLTKTARSQGQSVDYFREPFKLVPMADMAEMADKFTRNEIFSSNEIRGFLGAKPSKDPKADQLVNSNMPQSDTGAAAPSGAPPTPSASPNAPPSDAPDPGVMGAAFDEISNQIDQAFAGLGLDDGSG